MPPNPTNLIAGFLTSTVFMALYMLLWGLSSCTSYGYGLYTSDGACENSVYGYSFGGDLLAIFLPFIVVFYILKFYGFPKRYRFANCIASVVAAMLTLRLIFLLV